MASTTAEVIDRAANDLGVLRLGQALQSQDQTRMNSAYAEVYDQLKDEGLAIMTSTADVPDKLVPWIVALVALNASETYGVSDQRMTRILSKTGPTGDRALREIRKIVTPPWESLEEPRDY